MTRLGANFSSGKLTAGVGASDTVLSVSASLFNTLPQPADPDFVALTIADGNGNYEIVHCIANPRTGNITVVRGRESTAGRVWAVGALVRAGITAAAFSEIVNVQASVQPVIDNLPAILDSEDNAAEALSHKNAAEAARDAAAASASDAADDAIETAQNLSDIEQEVAINESLMLAYMGAGGTAAGVAITESLASGAIPAALLGTAQNVIDGDDVAKVIKPNHIKDAIDALRGRLIVSAVEPATKANGDMLLATARDGTEGFGAIEGPMWYYSSRWRHGLSELNLTQHFGNVGVLPAKGHFANIVTTPGYETLDYVGLPTTDQTAIVTKGLLAAIEYGLSLNGGGRFFGVDKVGAGVIFDLDALANTVGALFGGRYAVHLKNFGLMDLVAPGASLASRIMFQARKGENFTFEHMIFHRGLNADLAMNQYDMDSMGQDNHTLFDLKDTDFSEGPAEIVFKHCHVTGKGGGSFISAHYPRKIVLDDVHFIDSECNLDAHTDGPASFAGTNDVLNGITCLGGTDIDIKNCKFRRLYSRYAAAGTKLIPLHNRPIAIIEHRNARISKCLFDHTGQAVDMTGGTVSTIGAETTIEGNIFNMTYGFSVKFANTQGRATVVNNRAKFAHLAFCTVGTNDAFPDSVGPQEISIYNNVAKDLGRFDAALIPADHNGGAGYSDNAKAFVKLGGSGVNGIPSGVVAFGNRYYDEDQKIKTAFKADDGWQFVPSRNREPNLAYSNTILTRNRAQLTDKAFNPRVLLYKEGNPVLTVGDTHTIEWSFARENWHRMWEASISIDPVSYVDLATNTFNIRENGLVENEELTYRIGPDYKLANDALVSAAAMGGLTANTNYFAVNVTADSFQLAATSGGAAIDLTSVGAGREHALLRVAADKTRAKFRFGHSHTVSAQIGIAANGAANQIYGQVRFIDNGGTAIEGPGAIANWELSPGDVWTKVETIRIPVNSLVDSTVRAQVLVFGTAGQSVQLKGTDPGVWNPDQLGSHMKVELDPLILNSGYRQPY